MAMVFNTGQKCGEKALLKKENNNMSLQERKSGRAGPPDPPNFEFSSASGLSTITSWANMDLDQRSIASEPEVGDMQGEWRPGLDRRDVDRLTKARQDSSAIVEEIPSDKDSLSAFSVMCLLFNRMIGSGIFNSSGVVFYNTQSVGASLLMWLYGVVMALSGLVLYIDLGLTIPRWRFEDGIKISTPRSGGELPYVSGDP